MAGPTPSLADGFRAMPREASLSAQFGALKKPAEPSLSEQFASMSADGGQKPRLPDWVQRVVDRPPQPEDPPFNLRADQTTYMRSGSGPASPYTGKLTAEQRSDLDAEKAGMERGHVGVNQYTGGRVMESTGVGSSDVVEGAINLPGRLWGGVEAVGSALKGAIEDAGRVYRSEESKGQEWSTPDYKKPDVQANMRDPKKFARSLFSGGSPTDRNTEDIPEAERTFEEQERAVADKRSFTENLAQDAMGLVGGIPAAFGAAEQITNRGTPVEERAQALRNVTSGLIKYPGQRAVEIASDPAGEFRSKPLSTAFDVLTPISAGKKALKKGAEKALKAAERIEGGPVFDIERIPKKNQAPIDFEGQYMDPVEAAGKAAAAVAPAERGAQEAALGSLDAQRAFEQQIMREKGARRRVTGNERVGAQQAVVAEAERAYGEAVAATDDFRAQGAREPAASPESQRLGIRGERKAVFDAYAAQSRLAELRKAERKAFGDYYREQRKLERAVEREGVDTTALAREAPEAAAHLDTMKAQTTALREEAKSARRNAFAMDRKAGETAEAATRYAAEVIYEAAPKLRSGIDPRAWALAKKAHNMDAAANGIDRLMYWGNPIMAPFRLTDAMIWQLIRKGPEALNRAGSAVLQRAGKLRPGAQWFDPKKATAKLTWLYGAADDPRAVELAMYNGERRMAQGELSAWRFEAQRRMAALPEKDLPTFFEALHMENADLVPYVTRDMKAFPGERFKVTKLPDDPAQAARLQSWVETNNLHDRDLGLLEWLQETTRRSTESGLLDPSQVRDEVWKPNVYLDDPWREAKIQRLVDKGVSRRVAEDRVHDELIKQPSQTASLGNERIQGLSEKRRELAPLPIETRTKDYGMSQSLAETVWVRYMQQERDIARTRMWDRIADNPSLVSRIRKEGWVQVDNPIVNRVNGTRRHGTKLPETFYSHPDLFYDAKMNEWLMESINQSAWRPIREMIKFFKVVHTAFSPGTQATNFLGNAFALAPMAGIHPLNPANAKYFRQAAHEFATGGKGAAYREWYTSRPLGAGESTRAEVPVSVLRTYGDHMGGALNHGKDVLRATLDMTSVVLGRGKVAAGGAKRLATLAKDLPQLAYAANDEFWKFAAWLKYRAQGIDAVKAAETAEKWFGDYHNLGGFGKVLSSAPLGQPFVAFGARMISAFDRFMQQNPERGALMEAFWHELSKQNMVAAHTSPVMEEEYRRGLRRWDKNAMTGLSRIYPGLAEDEEGNLNFMNLMKYFPLSDMVPQGDEGWSDLAKRKVMGNNPVVSSTFQLGNNYDPAMRAEVVDEKFDSPELRQKKRLTRLTRTWLPGGEAYAQLGAAASGEVKPGRDIGVSLQQALLSQLAGIRTQTYSKEEIKNAPEFQQKFATLGYGKKSAGAVGKIRQRFRNLEEGKGDAVDLADVAHEVEYIADEYLPGELPNMRGDLINSVNQRIAKIRGQRAKLPLDRRDEVDIEIQKLQSDLKTVLESPKWTAQTPAQQEAP